MSQQKIFTIGYSGFQVVDFLDVLESRGISVLIDVRSNPYSKFHSDYNRNSIERILSAHSIKYFNYNVYFGAQQTDTKFYTDGFLNFEKFSQSENFKEGIKRVSNGCERGYAVALMCAEKDPLMCHRAILVSRHLQNYTINHIIPEQNDITQAILEQRLLEEYFPNRNQLTLFDNNKSDEELICEAYRLENRKIGYRKSDDEYD